jgi:hypothetical protein
MAYNVRAQCSKSYPRHSRYYTTETARGVVTDPRKRVWVAPIRNGAKVLCLLNLLHRLCHYKQLNYSYEVLNVVCCMIVGTY